MSALSFIGLVQIITNFAIFAFFFNSYYLSMNSFTQRDLNWINFIFFIYDLFAIHLYRIALNFAQATAERLGIAFFFSPIANSNQFENGKLKIIHDRKATMKLNSMRMMGKKTSGSSHMEIITKLRCAAHAGSVRLPQKWGKKRFGRAATARITES